MEPDLLTAAERDQLRRHVAAERDRTVARAAALQRDFDDIVVASADAVRDDEHDPEGATIAFERAQVAALIADATATLAALDVAAQRLDGAAPVTCEHCGGAIGYERLLARPTATRCVRCAAASR